MIDMAIEMLKQARETQISIQNIAEKASIEESMFINNSSWAKHVYNVVRGGIGIIEINTEELKVLSSKDIYKHPMEQDLEDDE
jgi:hypothetical protein